MIRLFRLAALIAVLSLTIPAVCESPGSLFDKGRTAEAKMDYEAAYTFYLQAWQKKPKDMKYKASMLRTRFLASSSYVHRGQQLRDDGKLDEALAAFKKAIEIDPASFIAIQELKRTQTMMQQQPPQGAAAQPGPLRKLIQGATGPIELKPLSDVPITLKLTEDTKTVYETVGKLAGINVLFDPDYTSRRIHVELNNVTLYDALEVVSMESKTFWRPVTPNTIFVAADTPAKRKELEQNVLKTFYLSNLSQPTELQDLVNTMRTVLEMSRITQLPSQNAIVVRGTPDQVALAEKLVGDLDKARAEVIVEVAVMQIKRDKLRDLGISPPTSASVALQPNITTTTGTNPATGTPTSGQQTGANTVNLNHIGNLTAKDFTVTIPAASVSAALSDSDTRLIQNPQIRALDGQKATLKIGDRVPVATGSFGGGLAGLTSTSLVQTQFQYIDVGVNVDITPYVHGAREITLKVALDISAVTGNSTIGGISQPIIGQRKVEHTIRLREGEVNMLGGIFEDNDVKSLSGFPGLAQVPFLKYLFSNQHTEHHENEIVFVLIPHIVRSPEVNEENMRPIDIGTANTIELRRSALPGAAPQAQPQPGPAVPQRPAPQPPAQQQPPAPQGQSGPATLMLNPPQATQKVGSQFTVDAVLTGQNIYSVPVQLQYNPNVLQLVNVSNGNFLSQDGQIVTLVHRDDPGTGTVQITATRPPNSGGASGQGTVFTLTFLAKAAGDAPVAITRAGIKDAVMQNIPVSGTKADITVK